MPEERTGRPTRKQLKASLSRKVPLGAEQGVLHDAERALEDAQRELRYQRRLRSALSSAISVRERKLADWKVAYARPPTRDTRMALTRHRASSLMTDRRQQAR